MSSENDASKQNSTKAVDEVDVPDTNQTHQDKEYRLNRQRFWLEVLTFVAVVVYATIAALQWFAMRDAIQMAGRANQIAISALTTAQRPWVGIVNPIFIDKPLTFDAKGANIVIRIKLKNFGVSPANAAIPITTMLLTEDLNEVTKYQKDICSWPAMKQKVGNLIFPNQEITSMPINILVDPPKIRTNSKGMTEAWLVGCLPYWDQFNQLRSTAVLYMFNLNRNAEFKPIGVIQGVFEPYLLGNVAN
jgi:hypothetical protein